MYHSILKNAEKLVSVVIPLYNSQETIKYTLNSILAQVYQVFEILLIDDGSEDHTPKIGAEYSKKFKNIAYYRKPNGGVASARNFGIKKAKGCFIAFCDHDDLWKPLKLQFQMPLFTDHQVGLVYSGSLMKATQTGKIFRKNNTYLEGKCFFQMLGQEYSPITSSSAIVRKDVFDRVGFFEEDERLKGIDDKHMWLRIAHEYKIKAVQDELVEWVYTGQNWSLNEEAMSQAAIYCISDIAKRFPAQNELESRFYEKAYHLTYFHYGKNFFNADEFQKARRFFKNAFKFCRFDARVILYFYASILPKKLILKLRIFKQALSRPKKP